MFLIFNNFKWLKRRQKDKREKRHTPGKTKLIFIEMPCTFSGGQDQISLKIHLIFSGFSFSKYCQGIFKLSHFLIKTLD